MCAIPIAALAQQQANVIVHQNIERHYELYEPPSIGSGIAPLVIALHGRHQKVKQLHGQLRMIKVAKARGFRIAYPVALEGNWSYGRSTGRRYRMPEVNGAPADDIGFIAKMIDQLIAKKITDPDRIYVVGVSRGALMTYAVACNLSEKIAAVAPLISSMTNFQVEDCKPKRAVPIIALAGTDDPLLFFDGWIREKGRLLSVSETMEFWRVRHGCTQQSEHILPNLEDVDISSIRVIDWLDCRTNAMVRLYRVGKGGHTIPAFYITEGPPGASGVRSRDMETAQVLWSLFSGITRK